MTDNDRSLIDILNKGLIQLGINSSPQCERQILAYVEELIIWSQKINLTAIKGREDIIVKHFLDSLVCLKQLDDVPLKLLDIGTGAGFPGLPLKIFSRDISVSLMEATGKKIHFLEELLRKLDIHDVQILHGRAEELCKKKELQGKYDVVVIRAVGELKLLIKHSFPFLKKGGYLLALKGLMINEEVEQSRKYLIKIEGSVEKIFDYELISGRKGKLVKIVKGNFNG